MNKMEALIQIRINHDLLTHKLVALRRIQEDLHSTIDTAFETHIEIERWLAIHEKAKE